MISQHYSQKGFLTQNACELDITDQDLQVMKEFMDSECTEPGPVGKFNNTNLEQQIEFFNLPRNLELCLEITFSVHGNPIPSTILTQVLWKFVRNLGHKPQHIWIRFSKLIPKPDLCFGTTVHRDWFDDRPLDALCVMVIHQENVNANMAIMDSPKGEIFRPNEQYTDYTTLWEAQSTKGQFYIINQKDFPRIHHLVHLNGDTTSQRYVLTIGITKQYPKQYPTQIKKVTCLIGLGCMIGYSILKYVF
jgi:hypothetical protein